RRSSPASTLRSPSLGAAGSARALRQAGHRHFPLEPAAARRFFTLGSRAPRQLAQPFVREGLFAVAAFCRPRFSLWRSVPPPFPPCLESGLKFQVHDGGRARQAPC